MIYVAMKDYDEPGNIGDIFYSEVCPVAYRCSTYSEAKISLVCISVELV